MVGVRGLEPGLGVWVWSLGFWLVPFSFWCFRADSFLSLGYLEFRVAGVREGWSLASLEIGKWIWSLGGLEFDRRIRALG